MQRFELTVPTSPAWVDLVRNLVAAGAAPLDLSVDRLADLTVLTGQVMDDLTAGPGVGSLRVALEVNDDREITVGFVTDQALGDAPVSKLALSSLANGQWDSQTEGGTTVGFTFPGDSGFRPAAAG